jgi:hypothetical protein|tara:strand:- start:596 stop:1093 length:498 start_codon:yes stop_codon:yes gene_type:complete
VTSASRRRYSSSTGRVAEVRFVRAAENLGLTVKKSSHTEDIHEHVDYWLALNDKGRWGVDVKGNNLPDEIWVELKNVRGNPGWIHGGATIIAFDMPEEQGFSVVDRLELKEWVYENVEQRVVDHKRDAYRKLYTRKDRQDVITRVMLQDIRTLGSYRVWKYFLDY